MAFTPSNRVYLLDTPLDNSYKNQLYFSNKNSQRDYFMSQQVRYIDDVDYIRKDNKIVVTGQLDDYWRCNYVMYQNSDFNERWFYAFITKMEWESERSFSIYIETDVYQTWLLDCKLLHSFVVREHVSDDTIGKHLVDEGLELGEYVMNSYEKTDKLGALWFIMAVSDTVSDTENVIRGIYGNVYSGLAFYAYAPTDYGLLSTKISAYVDAGKSDAIQFIYTVPRAILPDALTSGSVIPNGSSIGDLYYSFDTFCDNATKKARFKKLDDYEPINNKLYCYPYNVLYATNGNGNSAEYRFEDFKNFATSKSISFKIEGNMSPNPTIALIPRDYKGQSYNITSDGIITLYNNNYEHALTLSGFPLCSWGNDTFNAWVAQNAQSVAVAFGASGVAMIGGALTGNVTGVVGGAMGVISQMQQVHKSSLQPDQAKGNTNGSSLNVAGGRQDFFLSRLSIKTEYAERIDKFFTMYGYKVNAIKTPELHSRSTYNYIQTIDINIKGAIPADDMKQLKQIFNEGITLWHDPVKFCNYNFSNTIL